MKSRVVGMKAEKDTQKEEFKCVEPYQLILVTIIYG